MEAGLEAQLITGLAIAAAALMVVVTGGVAYLTLVEWADKRKRTDEKLNQIRPRARRPKSSTK
jgi:hypothetical protein